MKFCPVCGTEYADDIRFCQRDGQTLKSANPSGDLVGQVIADRYHVTKKLGEGGMGAVYLAEHVKMGRKSAIKVMSSSMSQDPDAVSRFNREANNASRIQHPNICAIYDFGETSDGLIYLAMEFIEGASLNDILKKSGPMTLQRATAILRQTAEALHVAHAAGIVHRDLKPDNIMIAQQAGKDLVKVVDFGIAKAVGGEETGQKVTKTGLVVGTPEYMSPEQLSGDKLDGRSDLYSLALVYYRMITGTLPFVAETSQETMIKRLTDDPMPLRQALPTGNFPPALQAAMDRALARYAGERYSDAVEFAKDVEAALVGFAPEGGATMVVGAADMKTMVAGAPPKTSAVPKTRVAGAAERGAEGGAPSPRPTETKKSPVGLIAAGVTVLALAGGGFAFKDKLLGGTGSDTTTTVRPESTTVARPDSTPVNRPDSTPINRPVPGNDPRPNNPRPNPGNTPTRDIAALEAEVNAMITPIIEGTNLEKRAAVRRAQEIFGYTDLPRDLRGLAASTAGSGYVEIAREAELSGDNVQARGSFQNAADWFERAMQYRPTSSTRDALQMARSKVSALDSN